ADAFYYQSRRFPGSVAPTLPGHLEGTRCPDVARYTEWVRGWLWAQDLKQDLVLVGYTLRASIALQYGLDYPDEGKGLVVMTVPAGGKVGAGGARRGRPEGLRRLAGVSAARDEVRRIGPARAADGAAPPGRPDVPIPRPDGDRRVRRARPHRNAQAEAPVAARA